MVFPSFNNKSSSLCMTQREKVVHQSKSKKNKEHRANLWNTFDTQFPKEPLECLMYQSSIQDKDFCDVCQSSLAFTEEGLLTCTNAQCGTLYKDMLDHSPEWRYYGAEDNHGADPTRCGMPSNPTSMDYGCKVLCGGKTTYEMRKISRYTRWQSGSYKEKTLQNDFQRITVYANNAGISKKIIDDAITVHKKISEYEQTFRGDNKDGLMAASIYLSCRLNHYPRTPKELATIFMLDVTSATQGCKNAQTILNVLEKDLNQEDKTVFGKTKPEDFIERYCSKLSMNAELTKLCLFIAIKIEKKELMPENTPHSIAAGIIYFISQLCHLNILKRDVKEVTEISEVTINKCCKKIEKMTDTLVPSIIMAKYAKPSSVPVPCPLIPCLR